MLSIKERTMKANNIKTFRQRANGLTQAKLAQTVGISEQHCQRLEYNKAEPKVILARKFADALGVETYQEFKDLFPLPGEKGTTP